MRGIPGFTITVLLFLAGVAGAQSATNASVTGLVSDPTNATIPGANITLINRDTGILYTGLTNSAGIYYVPNLPPGTYQIQVGAKGFRTVVKPQVIFHVQDALQINFELSVGSVAETITVQSGAPPVDLATSSIGSVVNATTDRELPLNGRSWDDLATLAPGVSPVSTMAVITSFDRIGRGLGNQLTINGSRPQQNNYLLNGISINDYTNGSPGDMLGYNLGVDAIEEFSLLTSTYPAEYGRTAGGVISAITRSGTNNFHGDMYEFLRNSALDARNFFDGSTIPPFRRNQFGASGGGPIIKDNTFIFGDYEGLREYLGVSQVDTVPSLAARAGNLCAPPDCSTTTPVAVDPEVAGFIKAFYPLPNGPALCPFTTCPAGAGDTAVFSFAGSQVSSDNFFTIRTDHRFSENDNISGTYTFDTATFNQTDEFDNKFLTGRTRNQEIAIQENHLLSASLINTFRFGVNRVHAANPDSATAINPAAKDPSYGAIPGEPAPVVRVSGLTAFSGGVTAQVPQQWNWTSWQGYNDLSWTKGIHSLKFGVYVERDFDNSVSPSAKNAGRWTFGSLADFLTNTPEVFAVAPPQLVTPRDIRQTIAAGYVQDDVHLLKNLTLNLGLRYETASVPSEAHGKFAVLHNLSDTNSHLGNPIYNNPTRANFEPRVGFAWDPFRNGRTAVRGGFGMFDVLPIPIELRGGAFEIWPFFDAASLTTFTGIQSPFPTNAYSSVPFTEDAAIHYYTPATPPRSYVMQWNFNIQRELTRSTTATLAYIGTRGIHLVLQNDDSNIVLPKFTSQGYVWPAPQASGTILNPTFSDILGTFFNSNSIYNALQLQVTRKLNHGLQVQGSYTWSKSIDSSSGTTDGDQFTNGITSLFFFDPRLRRGLSDFNVGQNLVINYIWVLPNPHSSSNFAQWVLGGWQLGGIFTIHSGQPFSAVMGGDPLGLNSTDPIAFPDHLRGPGCQSPVNPGNPVEYIKVQCFSVPTAPSTAYWTTYCDQSFVFPECINKAGDAGRNGLIGPGLVNFDMSLFKNIPIKRVSESFNIQFRVEAFNVFNRSNFAPPVDNNAVFDGSGNPISGAGLIDSTSTTSRQMQFALKVTW